MPSFSAQLVDLFRGRTAPGKRPVSSKAEVDAPSHPPPVAPSTPRPAARMGPHGRRRNWIFASALNRIWALVLKGKDVHESIEGWQQTYDQMKPYIGPVLNFLRMFLSSGSDGGPPMPPIIVT
jgi:hypothetical protein